MLKIRFIGLQKKIYWQNISVFVNESELLTATNTQQLKYKVYQYMTLLLQGVQLKSGPYFNMSNLFTKIYNMLYYTANLYLQ